MEISVYARLSVLILSDWKVINGMGDGTFNPKGNATRAQVAKMFRVFDEKVK